MMLALGVSPPAIADDASTPAPPVSGASAPTTEEVAAALASAGTLVEDGVPATATGDGFVVHTENVAVALPDDAGGPVIVEGDGGPVSIGVPGGNDADGVSAGDGVTYEGALADTSVVAKATDKGVQLLAVLASSTAPTSLSFPVKASPYSSWKLNPDGSVTLFESVATGDGEKPMEVFRGEFSAPWAVDANGVAVPTSYEVQGMALVQHVHPTDSTIFPVTADPSFDVGWTGLFAHWTRGEAKWLAGLSLAATAAAVGVLCTGPHVVVCAAAVGGIYYTLRGVADWVVDQSYDNGYRLTTRLTPFTSTYWEK